MFARLGDAGAKDEIDAGVASNDRVFWMHVEEACVTPFTQEDKDNDDKDCDIPHFPSNPNISNGVFDPSNIVKHGWYKLQEIWKDISKRHKVIDKDF